MLSHCDYDSGVHFPVGNEGTRNWAGLLQNTLSFDVGPGMHLSRIAK